MKLLNTIILSIVFVGMMPTAKADWLKFNRKNVIKVSKITGASVIFTCAALRSIHSGLLIWGLSSGRVEPDKRYKIHSGAKFFAINDAVFNAALAAYIAYQTVAYVWPKSVDDDTQTTQDTSDSSDKKE